MDGNGEAAEGDAGRVVRRIEPAVVDACRHSVFYSSGRYGSRDQAAHQEPRDAGIAVGEVELIGATIGVAGRRVAHMRGRAGIELQALEAGKAERPDIERRHRIDSDTPFA